MTNAHYTIVKRSSVADKQVMREIADSHNELGMGEQYSVERNQLVLRSFDRLEARTCFVRCSRCGAIRELWEGQIEFCDSCGADWDD